MAEGGTTECNSETSGQKPADEWRLVGPVDILQQRPCNHVYAELGKKSDLVLFCARGTFFAMEAWCSHMSGPLFNGDIEDYDGRPHVICPWHGYMFDIRTGENEIGLQQTVYPVKVEENQVYIKYKCPLQLQPYDKKG